MLSVRKKAAAYIAFAVVIGFLTLATFGSLSEHVFEDDDREYLADASEILADPGRLFSVDRINRGRPVIDLVFLAGFRLWGHNPSAYHTFLVALHLVSSLLLAFTLRRLGTDLDLSLLSALLFLMNVAHFRAIHWISSLAYPLALIFGLGIIICYSRFLKSSQKRWLVVAAIWMALAVWTHAATVPIALFCTFITWRRRRSIGQAVISSWPLTAAALAALLIAYMIDPHSAQVSVVKASPDLLRILKYLLWYWSRLATTAHWLPGGLSHKVAAWELAVGFLICSGIVVFCIKKGGPVVDWAVWSFVTMLPFLNNPQWMPIGPSRYLYLPSVGTSFILAYLIRTLIRQISVQLGARGGQIALGLILIVILYASSSALKRSEAVTFYVSGRSYITKGDLDSGTQLLERAISQAPDVIPSDTYLRLATIAFSLGKPYRCIFEKALAEDPEDPLLNMLLGASTFLQDDMEPRKQGEERIRKALDTADNEDALRRETAHLYQNMAVYYHNRGEYDRAVDLYLRAIDLKPDYPMALLNLGNALYLRGEAEEAIRTYTELLKLDPGNTSALSNLGSIYLDRNNYADALSSLQQAVNLAPGNWKAHVELAHAHAEAGRTATAVRMYRKALSLNPHCSQAREALKSLLGNPGARHEP